VKPRGPVRLFEPVMARMAKRVLADLPDKMRRGIDAADVCADPWGFRDGAGGRSPRRPRPLRRAALPRWPPTYEALVPVLRELAQTIQYTFETR